MSNVPTAEEREHIALSLAHRWFAFLEAPGGDLQLHLKIFHPYVRLSGHRGTHLFASDHKSLIKWFDAIPDEISSHHIVHSNFATAENGDGLLSMVVAYQAPGVPDVHGSIIAYETRIEFTPAEARFLALDKTPILSNTRSEYETSWSTNRVLALVHAELGGIAASDKKLRPTYGDIRQISAKVSAAEGMETYTAIVSGVSTVPSAPWAVRLILVDVIHAKLPSISSIELLNVTSAVDV